MQRRVANRYYPLGICTPVATVCIFQSDPRKNRNGATHASRPVRMHRWRVRSAYRLGGSEVRCNDSSRRWVVSCLLLRCIRLVLCCLRSTRRSNTVRPRHVDGRNNTRFSENGRATNQINRPKYENRKIQWITNSNQPENHSPKSYQKY